jgi:hypothetical protein
MLTDRPEDIQMSDNYNIMEEVKTLEERVVDVLNI